MLVKVPNAGAGVNKDLLPSELAPGVWSDVSNVRFSNGFAVKRKGVQAAYSTPSFIPYALLTYSTPSARFLVQGGLTVVKVDDGTTVTDITGTAPTGSIDDKWTGGTLNGVLVMNNGKDDPTYWNGDTATNLATLPGWTAGWKSDSIRPFKNYLVALGNTRGGGKQPHNVGWSSAAEPGAIPSSWTAATTNDAGDVDLAETPGVMVDCLPWGDVNIVYKQDARYVMQYIGGNDVFSFQKLPGDDGLLARGCAVNTPKGQVFLSNGDVLIHQGGQAQSIVEGRLRRWMFANLDSTYATRSFLAVNPQFNEVWVCVPSTGSSVVDTVYAWNWENDTWGIFSIANLTAATTGLLSSGLSAGTFDSDTDSFDSDATTFNENEFTQNEQRLILATNTPRIGLADTGTLDFGSTVSWSMEKTGIAFDDPDSIKVASAIRPHFKGLRGTQCSVYLGSSMTADGDPTYSTAGTFTQGTTNLVNRFSKGGRFLAVKFEGTNHQPLALRSYDIEFTKAGRF